MLLALVGMVTPPERKSAGRAPEIDEVLHRWSVAIVDTPTPPTGPRRIDLSRWEDLLRAAELLGRPILRLRGGESEQEGELFYVADGSQNYVFDFGGAPVKVSRSGAYAPPVRPVPIPLRTPVATVPSEVARTEPIRPRPVGSPPLVIPASPVNAATLPEVAESVEAPRGTEFPEPPADADLPTAVVVERRIREMIHELLADFRQLPPSSDRLELGTEHIQRAVDMLHLGRYGVAQIELNKAARLLREEPPG